MRSSMPPARKAHKAIVMEEEAIMAKIACHMENEVAKRGIKARNLRCKRSISHNPCGTDIMQRFQVSFVSDGKVKTEMILFESRTQRTERCIGASAARREGL